MIKNKLESLSALNFKAAKRNSLQEQVDNFSGRGRNFLSKSFIIHERRDTIRLDKSYDEDLICLEGNKRFIDDTVDCNGNSIGIF